MVDMADMGGWCPSPQTSSEFPSKASSLFLLFSFLSRSFEVGFDPQKRRPWSFSDAEKNSRLEMRSNSSIVVSSRRKNKVWKLVYFFSSLSLDVSLVGERGGGETRRIACWVALLSTVWPEWASDDVFSRIGSGVAGWRGGRYGV